VAALGGWLSAACPLWETEMPSLPDDAPESSRDDMGCSEVPLRTE
jgi:hypothetical protein